MDNFKNFNLPNLLKESLERMEFSIPTPIQAKAIPIALEGRDVLGSARTGTGKTAAFAIPIIAKLMEDSSSSALIMAPTRELATQVYNVMRDLLSEKGSIRQVLLIGGDSMFKQLHQLRMKPRLVIGTPGRINDHLKRKSLSLKNTNLLVLDEIDRMLDMGFGIQIEEINKYLPQQRQTLMFSATLPPQIVKLSERYLSNPERIEIGSSNNIAENLKQNNIFIEHSDKYKELIKILPRCENATVIFVKTKIDADRLADKLGRDDFEAEAIHGDLQQRRRERVIKGFRDKKYNILVATDIAARGLDIPHIDHVINYDLPQCPEDFIHRVGRTARAGSSGEAISFISSRDKKHWHAICKLLNPGQTTSDTGFTSEGKSKKKKSNFRERRPNKFGNKKPNNHFQAKKLVKKDREILGLSGEKENTFKAEKTGAFERRRFLENPRKKRLENHNEGGAQEGFRKKHEGFRKKQEGFGDRNINDHGNGKPKRLQGGKAARLKDKGFEGFGNRKPKGFSDNKPGNNFRKNKSSNIRKRFAE